MSARVNKSIAFIVSILLASTTMAQDKTIKDVLSLKGYLKNLTTVFVPPGADTSIIVDNLLHNRLDFAWYVNEKLTFNTSMRNQLFYGESVKAAPALYDRLAEDPGFMDLSILWFNSKGAAFYTTFDRLNIDYQTDKWQVIVGRQRINWGVNLIWNPNDIFNSYSYFDFDYEERIGTDALLGRYYFNETSSAELIINPTDTSGVSFAGMYKRLVKNYDVQAFAGYLTRQLTFGGAWAGDIKGAGFRGEFSVFLPSEKSANTKNQFVGAVDADYTFPNTLYLHASYLFNSLGINAKTGDYRLFFLGSNISAQSLSPAMHNIFAEVGWNANPIVRLTFASWFNPSDASLFVGPSANWSASENFQVLFNVQWFLGKDETLFGAYGSFYYLRFKYSF